MSQRSVPPLVGSFVSRRLRAAPSDVVFIKGVLEASEGLAGMFAEGGGDLTIATSAAQLDELDRVLADLCAETGALLAP